MPRLDPFTPRELINGLVQLLAPEASRRGLSLIPKVAAEVPPWILGDATRIRQVLLNLAGNALKFTEAGSVHIELTVEGHLKDQVLLGFAVADTGIGIPLDRQQAVFEAFCQADDSITRRYGGTGLGLAICDRYVQCLGGRLRLQSQPGAGSRFSFQLAASPCPAPPIVETPEDPIPTGSLRILVVEDNLVNRLEAGMDGYLSKPIHPQKLRQILSQSLALRPS